MLKIDGKTQFTEAYHYTMDAVDRFSRLSPNIPKVMLKVIQNIYGRFDSAAYHLNVAANTFIKSEKLMHLEKAQTDLFFQYSSLEMLVRTKCITVGSANEVIKSLIAAHQQTSKWLNSVRKNYELDTGVTAASLH